VNQSIPPYISRPLKNQSKQFASGEQQNGGCDQEHQFKTNSHFYSFQTFYFPHLMPHRRINAGPSDGSSVLQKWLNNFDAVSDVGIDYRIVTRRSTESINTLFSMTSIPQRSIDL
jgi:hypothetical protein